MIVTDSNPDSKSSPLSDSESRSIAAAPSNSLAAPPAYQVTPATPSLTYQMPPTQPLVELKSREPTRKRFLKAFCFAAIVYLLLSVLVMSFIDLAEKHVLEGVPSGPHSEDGRILKCMPNNTLHPQINQQPLSTLPPYSEKSTWSIPVSSNLLFLLSRGSYGHGSIRFELSDDSGDQVEINVVMSYYSLAARNRATICLLERDEGGRGVGFFTPRRILPSFPDAIEQLTVDIIVRFPKSGSPEHPLVINALETSMGIWSHHAANLEERVIFKSLELKGSNSFIRAESVSAESGKFITTNGPITGSYNVTDSLVLHTSNQAITANFRLENRDGHKPTKLEMRTSNARIETPITLVSTDQSSSPSAASFSVCAKTSNGKLDFTFPSAPKSPFSHLTLFGMTSNAQTTVKLHPTYEGSVSLKTSNFIPSLVQKSAGSDPSGHGRLRNMEVRKVARGALEAGVWWGDDPNKDDGKGSVIVKTSNARNVVELG